jgi:uncharacterized protein YjiS (DUF1127 family)
MTTLSTELSLARPGAARGAIREGLARLAARLAARRLRADTLRDLAHLNDHALRDIGLTRDGLGGAGRQAALDLALRLRPFL